MAAKWPQKSLVEHLLRFDDTGHIKENILNFLSPTKDEQRIDYDYLESLNIIVSYLLNTTNTEQRGKPAQEQWMVDVLTRILTETCIPALRMPRPTAYDEDKRDKLKIFELTYDLVSKIVYKGHLENAQYIWILVLKSLKSFVDECKSGLHVGHEVDGDGQLLQVETALHLLANLLDTVNNWQDDRLMFVREENFEMGMEETVLYAVLDVLSVVGNESLLFKITGQILPLLLSINEQETIFQNTKIIWESIKVSNLQEQGEKQHYSSFSSAYAIISSLADLYFKESDRIVFKIHQDPAFWSMVQTGLVNIDSLVRKRSLYLLQRVVQMCKEQGQLEKVCLEKTSPVFWWDPNTAEAIVDIWQQFVFFLEILEEKQLHVIQPVLPRLVELINPTKKTNGVTFPLLHVSWLSVIVHRAAIHENRFVKKWGISILLTLDLAEVPMLEHATTRNFTCDTFIMLLKEPTLYAKNHGEGKAEPSALAKQLLGFFKKCFHALRIEKEKIGFFMQVFTSISRYNISHVPLTFISQSLSNVPRFALFSSELLTITKSIILNMVSHSVILRGAVKTFLLRTFMNFVNPTSVTVHELLVFLGSFVKEESLCRGSSLWNEVTAWLSVNLDLFQRETKVLFTCLDNHVRSFLKDEYRGKTREVAVRLAKFLLLCYDCSAITKNELNQVFDTIFVAITKAQSNVYHPVSSSWQAAELIYGLFHELLPVEREGRIADDITITLVSCLLDVLDVLTQTLIRTISQADECSSFYGYCAYFAMLEKLKSLWLTHRFLGNTYPKYQTLLNKLADLGLSHREARQETQCSSVKRCLHCLVSLKMIIWVIEVTDATDFVLTSERRSKLLKCVWPSTLASNLRFPNEGKCHEGSYLKEDSWRIVAEDIITTKWRCVNLALKRGESKVITYNSSSDTLSRSSCNDIVEACVESLSLTSGAACYPGLETLRRCLPEVIENGDKDTTILLLKTAWSVLNEIRTRYSGYFWPAFDIVVGIVFAPELLNFPADSLFISYVRQYWESLLRIADDQSGLVSVAVAHLCKVFSGMYRSQSVNVMSLDCHVDIIADICMFGPVHKKDLKLLLETGAYLKCMGSGVVSSTKFKECDCESARVRVDLLAFLLGVDSNDQTYSLLLVKLIRALLERNQTLSKIKASRFLNSENHRQKQRLWQVILILVSRIADGQFALEFSNSVQKALESDNQTSVRFFMEWSLVRLFSCHIHLLETVWQQMKNLYKIRLGYVASLISIVTHVFFTLEEPESQMKYLQRLMPAIVPCAFLNHSQIRAYIFAALQLISDTCYKDVWSQICQQFPVVQSCMLFAESVVEGEKENNRLQKDRDLFSLHPIRDFSIEVIFKTVPLIAGVVDDEVITPGVFESEGSASWVEMSDLPLYRSNPKQGSGKEEMTPELCVVETAPKKTEQTSSYPSVAVTLDVQKKITPWNVIAPPQEDHDSFDHQRPIERRTGNLIVVASLIDRAPNLGGLCRTCEIFGASRLVLGSKHVVSEKDFKSVSVSSEKWVDVEEVKVHDLKMYLLRMRKEGFTVVGVEQTAQSKNLTDFQFPRSTVLVLGNEKAGIPVEVIQLLDDCVEIPQHGIIRSLNVHVSGALLIWEYSRQHLNDK